MKPSLSIKPYKVNGELYINLGRYPQTLVSDKLLISNLNKISKTNNFGYIEYNGEEYKKVVANTYESDYTFSNGSQIKTGSTYYFKVEPIKWMVLQEANGTYKLLSEYILDNMCYYKDNNNRTVNGQIVYANNYMYSNARAWLNGLDGSSYGVSNYKGNGFLDIAFTEEEREFINTTLVDNSASTSSSLKRYVCSNTNDKIYILSYKDVLNPSYGFNRSSLKEDTVRCAIVSDYARSKGCLMSTNSSYYGKGHWWLRSPFSYYSNYASNVNLHGYATTGNYVYNSNIGARPALEITIK